MQDERFTPGEASKRLGISTSKLRRYVSNFTHLFSTSARRNRDRRYTSGDIDVFKGIEQLGDKIALISPWLSSDHLRRADEPGLPLSEGPATPESLTGQLRELRDQVSSFTNLSQLEWSLLSQMQERLQQRIDLLAGRVKAKPLPSVEYRRIAYAPTWHWNVACPNYPRHRPSGARFIARKSLPPIAKLCPVCKRLDMSS